MAGRFKWWESPIFRQEIRLASPREPDRIPNCAKLREMAVKFQVKHPEPHMLVLLPIVPKNSCRLPRRFTALSIVHARSLLRLLLNLTKHPTTACRRRALRNTNKFEERK
ncbi:uncharacterized protein LOC143352481 [Halictus rubicundus]|uniref:uncharacterized protein LOC143352481 n=1 Tax=Halictus rubicundus TaxID=77578 RepID=UPI004036ECAB